MFGYITAYKPELKIREWELYQAVYCGLCKELGRNYGPFSRMFLSYDFVFLALLIESANGEDPAISPGRCMLNPVKIKPICKGSAALSYCAALSLLFLRYKILDNIRDKPFWHGLKWRFLKLLTWPSCRRAKKRLPGVALRIDAYIGDLHRLEEENCPILDEIALLFGEVLQDVGQREIADPAAKRIAGEMLKTLGRWIYILDAFEDLAEDEKNKAYNPLFTRFEKAKGEETDAFRNRIRGEVEFTLTQSLAASASAFALLEENHFNPILHNILYLGLRARQQTILSGKGERRNYGSV